MTRHLREHIHLGALQGQQGYPLELDVIFSCVLLLRKPALWFLLKLHF
jgi:hypothetical protein